MRNLPTSINDALKNGTTSFCYCWQIRRADGSELGLTNHDRPLEIDGVVFHANSGIELTALESRLGLAPHGAEANGILGSPHLRADDLKRGLYDNAAFTLWLADWGAPENRLLLLSGYFGAVRYQGSRFSVSLRGRGQSLNQIEGRVYQKNCPADLGDAQCRFQLAREPFQWQGAISAISGNHIYLPALTQRAGWFRGGHILTADNHRLTIRNDESEEAQRRLTLWETPPPHLRVGAAITLQTGCDKSYTTCVNKFDNAVNFQGFPTLADENLLISI